LAITNISFALSIKVVLRGELINGEYSFDSYLYKNNVDELIRDFRPPFSLKRYEAALHIKEVDYKTMQALLSLLNEKKIHFPVIRIQWDNPAQAQDCLLEGYSHSVKARGYDVYEKIQMQTRSPEK